MKATHSLDVHNIELSTSNLGEFESKVKPHIFREYDIRGDVGTELTADFAFWLGQAYGAMAAEQKAKKIAIGFDCRLTSEAFAKALAKGIVSQGLSATIIGMGPTPQLYFAVYAQGFDGGIQVTGSHNPPEMNGFKLCIGTNSMYGAAIQQLRERVESFSLQPRIHRNYHFEMTSNAQAYLENLVSNSLPHMGTRKIKVVVDAGNGVGGMIGPQLLRRLDCEVIELFCTPDGRFPNHHPDPTLVENITDMIAAVKEHNADLGIGWDGDADRIGVVDQRGEIVFGDMLMILFARQVLKEQPGATIIGDVKCSTRLFTEVGKLGGRPLMWKTGHSLIKKKLKDLEGSLAGEMSGHIMFAHRYFGFDDALYASARLVEILSNAEQSLSQLLSDIAPMVSTPEIRVDCKEELKFEIANQAARAFPDFVVDTTDGVRISFEDGWGLVRASNTQPILVMRFEATSAEKLEQYQALVTERVKNIEQKLLDA